MDVLVRTHNLCSSTEQLLRVASGLRVQLKPDRVALRQVEVKGTHIHVSGAGGWDFGDCGPVIQRSEPVWRTAGAGVGPGTCRGAVRCRSGAHTVIQLPGAARPSCPPHTGLRLWR